MLYSHYQAQGPDNESDSFFGKNAMHFFNRDPKNATVWCTTISSTYPVQSSVSKSVTLLDFHSVSVSEPPRYLHPNPPLHCELLLLAYLPEWRCMCVCELWWLFLWFSISSFEHKNNDLPYLPDLLTCQAMLGLLNCTTYLTNWNCFTLWPHLYHTFIYSIAPSAC